MDLEEFTQVVLQTKEELNMTNEDIAGRSSLLLQSVAQREELDQMYSQGKSAAGKEFEVYTNLIGYD